ncbi:hypothetical protein BRC77_14425 [Halobacteriales archaeon QH_8_64_26]|nr:MAG: hypothetical protein BRC77_14425 [Halobacteriales archaeon QH_8_64_26]
MSPEETIGMQLVAAQVVDMLFEFIAVFGEVALSGPLSAILLLCGAVLTLFTTGFLGYLVAGAALSTIGSIGRSPPPEAK